MRKEGLMLAAGLLALAGPAAGIEGISYIVGQVLEQADNLGHNPIVHQYDDVPGGTLLEDYHGFGYGRTGWVHCPSGQFTGFPPIPESPRCNVFAAEDVVMIRALGPENLFVSVRGWCATGAPFVNPNGILIEAVDLLGGIARGTCKSSYGTAAHFDVTTQLPADYLRIAGTRYYYALDHLIFER